MFRSWSAVLGVCSSERTQKLLKRDPLDAQKLVATAGTSSYNSPKSYAYLNVKGRVLILVSSVFFDIEFSFWSESFKMFAIWMFVAIPLTLRCPSVRATRSPGTSKELARPFPRVREQCFPLWCFRPWSRWAGPSEGNFVAYSQQAGCRYSKRIYSIFRV